MSMKMTEGMERTNALFARLEAHGVVLSNSAYSVFRLFEGVAREIDQALADGAEQDALASLGSGNGHADASPFADLVPPTADPVGLDPDTYRDVVLQGADAAREGVAKNILTPGPVGFAHQAYGVAPDGEVRALAPHEYAHGVQLAPAGVQVSGPEAPEPKKKRGRPKGSKAKKAKAGKRTKAPVTAEESSVVAELPQAEPQGEAAT